MTLYQFNSMDEMEQAEAVWSGTHIGDRQDELHNILLYQIDAFYVEAYYHREHNELVRFRSFASVEHLAPYLGQININELVK
jgi:hypothetical protein